MIAVGQDCFDYQVNKSAMCKNGLIWSSDLCSKHRCKPNTCTNF